MKLILLIFLLLILLCVTPVMAVTYPEEYYTLQSQSDSYEQFILNLMDQMKITNNMWDAKAQLILHYDLERQNILTEKQNELQEELVKAQWVETCYKPSYSGTAGNYSAWRSECAKAGYSVG
jgi:hypothetical protein